MTQVQGTLEDLEWKGLQPGRFESLVIAPVMEHLPDPAVAMSILTRSAANLGTRRIVMVVPGEKAMHPTVPTRRSSTASMSTRTGRGRKAVSRSPA